MSSEDKKEMDEMILEVYEESEMSEAYEDEENLDPVTGLESTGRNKTINGFPCEEYISLTEDNYVQIWATKDVFNLTDQINEMVEKLDASFDSGSDNDEMMYQVPGHINILVIEITHDFMSGLSYQREEYTAIETSDVPASLLKKPTAEDGYILLSYKDLLEQMQRAFDDAMDE